MRDEGYDKIMVGGTGGREGRCENGEKAGG